jgi:hypothetical protein
MVEGRLQKIALMWMPKQKRARGRPKKKLVGRNEAGHERKKPKWKPVGRQEAMSRRRTT